ncbi:methyltransferase family protein [Burkholderiales bacterium JOSHI_001]|nr:methyltransferase family protein [Burkholderiales bacterium JOSHI_001]
MMSDWNSGYISELDYTHGYYPELAPQRLALALLSKQQAHRRGRPLRYLELGFGQGLSLNIHAAATPGIYWGTDFNPAHAANARDLADASGANLRVLDDSFEELARRDDLPQFDVIALHGIWSWISDANRRVMVDIARRRLAVGGVMYVSYNCTPGWSAAMPLRHLMMLHANLASNEAQGMLPKVEAALDFAQRVVDSGAQYFAANPAVTERLKRLRDQNRQYLAHEYFNGHWLPMPFSDVAGLLTEAKLDFAASASLMDHIDLVNLTPAQQALLAEVKHPLLGESMRDYLVNQQFRRDLWVKGSRPLVPARQLALLAEQRFVLCVDPGDINLKVNGALGEAELQKGVYLPVVEQLAALGGAPRSAGDIAQALPGLSFAQVAQALLVLTASGQAAPAQDESDTAGARPHTDALNRHLIGRAATSGEITYLASPVTGSGVPVGRFQQQFLASIAAGRRESDQWAADAWAALSRQGERLVKDGQALATDDENLGELRQQAAWFQAHRLSVLKALGITG